MYRAMFDRFVTDFRPADKGGSESTEQFGDIVNFDASFCLKLRCKFL